MGDTWIVDITHFLDEDGRLAPKNGPALRLADLDVIAPLNGR